MNLHHLFCRHTGSRMEIIHVLRNEQELIRAVGKLCDCLMRGVRLRIANALPALAIPIPNQLRIATEPLRCRQLWRIKIPPVTFLSTKSRNAAFSGNTSAGEDE